MKQSEFAARLGVARNSINRWEAGERLPDGGSLQQMAVQFGADISFILTGRSGGAAPALRPDEQTLLDHYRAANSDARERIRQIAATAADSPKREKKNSIVQTVVQTVTAPNFGNISGGNIKGK